MWRATLKCCKLLFINCCFCQWPTLFFTNCFTALIMHIPWAGRECSDLCGKGQGFHQAVPAGNQYPLVTCWDIWPWCKDFNTTSLMTWLITGTIKNSWHVFCLSETYALLASHCLFVCSAYCNVQCKHRNQIFQFFKWILVWMQLVIKSIIIYFVHRDWISLPTWCIFSKIQPILMTFDFHARKHLGNSVQHIFCFSGN